MSQAEAVSFEIPEDLADRILKNDTLPPALGQTNMDQSTQTTHNTRRRRTTPLFDPTGLSASAEASESGDLVEMQRDNVLARPPEPANDGSEKYATIVNEEREKKRGRRRRSSERVNYHASSSSSPRPPGQDRSYTSPDLKEEGCSPHTGQPSQAKLWWQRGRELDESNLDATSSSMGRTRSAEQRPHPLSIDAQQPVADRSRQFSSETYSSQSPSSSRSPAAAFLSSMNDRLASPPSASFTSPWTPHSRNYSLSPNRSDGTSSLQNSMYEAQNTNTHMPKNEQDAQFGIGSAAATLFNPDNSETRDHPFPAQARVDEEGYRFGPGGRYTLGRTIGFGGFSTVREAWDLGREVHDVDPAHGVRHRVAVKLVYIYHAASKAQSDDTNCINQELGLWKNLPAHPNLLPLLHHETVENETGLIQLLVMPFCEGSLLSFVKACGTLPGAASTLDLSRKSSITKDGSPNFKDSVVRSSSLQKWESPPSLPGFPRTGSGFISPGHRSSTVGERIVSVPLSTILARTSSLAGSAPEGSSRGAVVRRSSIRARASNTHASRGIPIQMAKDVVQQMAEAMFCLHHKASVLHGDIKLENILGQQWVTPTEENTEARVPDAKRKSDLNIEQNNKEDQDSVLVSTSICWRLADFGLAKRVSISDERIAQEDGHPIASMHYVVRQARATHNSKGEEGINDKKESKSHLGGGSLAYTAPEAFWDLDGVSDKVEASPFAPDMWALGCVLYALFAGRLPFVDPFEPRLQKKISQGSWEMPDRLLRRRQIRARGDESRGSQMPIAHSHGLHGRESSASTQDSDGSGRPISLQLDKAFFEGRHSDLSASLPVLPTQEGGITQSSSSQSDVIWNGDSHVMHSINVEEEHEDTESDCEGSDTGLDSLNGTSRDRIAVRRVLRGLLDPNPRKRWTVKQLIASEWLRASPTDESPKETQSIFIEDSAQDQDQATPNSPDLLHNQYTEMSQLAQDTIPEHDVPEAEKVPTMEEESLFARRGRSTRRRGDSSDMERARPIAIDGSKSRSRSRGAPSPAWDMEVPTAGGGFHGRVSHDPQPRPQHYDWVPSADERAQTYSTKRSTSVDTHAQALRNARPSGRRHNSRSTSRSRRAELEHIMPQLSLHQSANTSNHSTPASNSSTQDLIAPPAADTVHGARRNAIWKSSHRARDRLATLIGSSKHSSQSSTPSVNEDQHGP